MTDPHSTPEAEMESRLSRLTPLHYAILRELPDEGRLHAGLTPQVASARYISAQINAGLPDDAKLTAAGVGAELRSLRTIGLTLTVVAISGRPLGWQRTTRAAELVAARDGTDPR